MNSLYSCFIFLLLIRLPCAGQQLYGTQLPDIIDTPASELFGNHLNDPGKVESNIRLLLMRAEKCTGPRANLDQLQYLQLALTLEDYARPNSPIVFELNKMLGFVLPNLAPRYSLLFMKKAETISRINPDAGNIERSQLLGAIAGVHKRLNEPDSALYYYQQAFREENINGNVWGQASAINNIGIFYNNIGKIDSAAHYFELAKMQLGAIRNDSMLFCSIRDNIAQVHEETGDFAFALRSYEANDTVFTRHHRWHRVFFNRIRILNAKYNLKQWGLEKDIQEVEAFIVQYKSYLKEADMLLFYRFAKKYFMETGLTGLLEQYDRAYTELRDAIDKKNKELTDVITNAFLSVQAERFRREADAYRIESVFSRQITWVVAVTGVVIILLLFRLLRRRKRMLDLAQRLKQSELRAKALEVQAMEQALELRKRDITDMALHHTQVLENLQRVMDRLTDISKQKDNTKQAIQTLYNELQAQVQVTERTQAIRGNVDKANAEFFQVLKQKFPDLLKTEVELCGYLRVGLSNKEIAALKNIAPSSVKVSKTRLRKRLGLVNGDDLEAFMQHL